MKPKVHSPIFRTGIRWELHPHFWMPTFFVHSTLPTLSERGSGKSADISVNDSIEFRPFWMERKLWSLSKRTTHGIGRVLEIFAFDRLAVGFWSWEKSFPTKKATLAQITLKMDETSSKLKTFGFILPSIRHRSRISAKVVYTLLHYFCRGSQWRPLVCSRKRWKACVKVMKPSWVFNALIPIIFRLWWDIIPKNTEENGY